MKKIMILGGGANQLGLLNAAKKEGYFVILCDKNFDCLGKAIADKFYDVDIIDYEKIKKIGELEKIDGIIANTESIMCNVAKLTTALGLVGNKSTGIEVLESKSKFRNFQSKIGVLAPKQVELADINEIASSIESFSFPIIIKPAKCSGTRGTTKIDLYDEECINFAVKECMRFSRDKKCVIEEYIDMPSNIVVEGDVFVCAGKVFYGGLFFTVRSRKLLMVPMTYMSPYIDSEENIALIQNTINKIFKELDISHGEFNIEGYFNEKGEFFVIEINARQGGHGLPIFLKTAIDIDMDKLLVTTSVGDNSYFEQVVSNKINQHYATRHSIFSDVSGRFQGITIDPDVEKFVVNVDIEKKVGELVEKRKNGSSVIGFVDLIFDTYEQQHQYSEEIEKFIYPLVKE